VDHRGRVFDPSQGRSAVHEGLFVADGSIIPTAVGVNPLLTIAALAERIAALIQEDSTLDLTPRPFALQRYVPMRAPVGLSFSEQLSGYLTDGITGEAEADYRHGEVMGRKCDSRLTASLWIGIEDLEAFLHDPRHQARVKGSITYAPLWGARTVEGGSVLQLFVPGHTPQEKQIRYALRFTGADGCPYLLDAFKSIRDDPGCDLWADTTTLFATLSRGDTPEAPILGRGLLHVSLWRILEQLASLRLSHATHHAEVRKALVEFGRFFFGSLWETYR